MSLMNLLGARLCRGNVFESRGLSKPISQSSMFSRVVSKRVLLNGASATSKHILGAEWATCGKSAMQEGSDSSEDSTKGVWWKTRRCSTQARGRGGMWSSEEGWL